MKKTKRFSILFLIFIIIGIIGYSGCENTPTDVILECEVEGYPCSLSEVPIEILERSVALGEEVLAMFESGDSTAEIEAWLNEQEDMAEVQADDLAVRFRLDGGRGTWILREEAFASQSAPVVASSLHRPARKSTTVPHHIVGEDTKQKSALVLSPMQWDLPGNKDGETVTAILASTRGYENVTHHSNETLLDTKVNIVSFKGWNGYQVIHIDSHGTLICKEGDPCRAVIAFITCEAFFGKSENQKCTAEDLATIEEKGVVPIPHKRKDGKESWELGLEAEFFRNEYSGGLDNTLIFFNSCESYSSKDTDLANALRGSTSVFLGWDNPVDIGGANATSKKLYQDLSEKGYTVETAYNNLGNLKTDSYGHNLILGKRKSGGDLRIRDVVYLLNPVSGQILSPSDSVAIDGKLGDDVPDAVPYLVQVDGVKKEFASDVLLHVSVDMVEAEPQPLSSGEVNDQDQWKVSGEVPLPYDLEEETAVTFLAWVELPSGGESDHETTATLTGDEGPIMGLLWEMEVTTVTGHYGAGTSHTKTANLTLEFAEGQDANEPHPRYFVTGGTVTYEAQGYMDTYLCNHSAPEVTFELTGDMIPDATSDEFWHAKLEFDTTVAPVEYWGYIFTFGPDLVVQRSCPDGNYTTNYGGASSWLSVDSDDHKTVTNLNIITGSHHQGSAGFHDQTWTITRIK